MDVYGGVGRQGARKGCGKGGEAEEKGETEKERQCKKEGTKEGKACGDGEVQDSVGEIADVNTKYFFHLDI